MQTILSSKQNVPVLLVGCQQCDRDALHEILTRPKWKLMVKPNCREAQAFLRQHRLPLVICDDEMPDSNWRLLLDSLADLADPPSLIVSSRLADERLWAEVLNLGGYDVLPTPFDSGEVSRVALLAAEFWERQFGAADMNRSRPRPEVRRETDQIRYSVCRSGC